MKKIRKYKDFHHYMSRMDLYGFWAFSFSLSELKKMEPEHFAKFQALNSKGGKS